MDPDPYLSFYFADLGSDQSFHFNADPAHHQSDANLRPLVFRPKKIYFQIFSPGFHFEPVSPAGSKLIDIDFNAEPDLKPAFNFN